MGRIGDAPPSSNKLLYRRGPRVLLVTLISCVLLQIRLHALLNNPDGGGSHLHASPQLLRNRFEGTKPDGTFNNVPIVYVPPSKALDFHSTAHCIGETFTPMSWVYRSCAYQNLCYDTHRSEFVVFRSKLQKSLDDELADASRSVNHTRVETISSALNTTVSLGGINVKWTKKDQASMEWSPIVRDYNENDIIKEGYYVLPLGTVLIPFHR
jgi:hypothetical protein